MGPWRPAHDGRTLGDEVHRLLRRAELHGGARQLHYATDSDDATDEPRWGKVGKQRTEDAGPLPPERMKTVDKEFLDASVTFMKNAKEAGKPCSIS